MDQLNCRKSLEDSCHKWSLSRVWNFDRLENWKEKLSSSGKRASKSQPRWWLILTRLVSLPIKLIVGLIGIVLNLNRVWGRYLQRICGTSLRPFLRRLKGKSNEGMLSLLSSERQIAYRSTSSTIVESASRMQTPAQPIESEKSKSRHRSGSQRSKGTHTEAAVRTRRTRSTWKVKARGETRLRISASHPAQGGRPQRSR